MKKVLFLTLCVIFIIIFCTFVSAAPSVNVIDLNRATSIRAYDFTDYQQGYYRAEFNVPSGEIWRAIVNVGEQSRLYINGQEIDFKPFFMRRQGFYEAYRTHAVDIAPYLNPGTNCIGIHAQRKGAAPPFAYMHGRVIMSDGQSILLDMIPTNPDLSWRGIGDTTGTWSEPGFTDNSWNILVTAGYSNYAARNLESWPGYDGPLVFENPDSTEDKLFYMDNESMIVDVVIPTGMTGDIEYILERANDGGTFTVLTSNTQSSYSTRSSDNSKVYRLNLGTRPRGVYTLEVSLVSGGNPVESRIPEAIVVVGKIDQTEVIGTSLEQGFDIDNLEAEIDFTTDGGWVETYTDCGSCYNPDSFTAYHINQPTIVDTGTLRYRQTYREAKAMFSYQYTFDEPGDWYLMVLDYPDDANRWTGVSITRIGTDPGYVDPYGDFRTESGPAVVTGYKYPLSGEMKEMKWLHRADTGLHTIDIVSLAQQTSAAARRIRIYHVNGEIPAMPSNNNRDVGIWTESVIGHTLNFAVKNPGASGGAQSSYTYENLDYDMLQRKTQRLLWQLDSMEHYAQYMRFLGQNTHAMGTYMYNDDGKTYLPPYIIKTASINPVADIRDVALRVFEANGISMMSNIEYSNPKGLRMQNDAVYGVNINDTRPHDNQGNPVAGGTPQLNFAHPWVKQAYLHSMNEIAAKFSSNPAWKGLHFLIVPTFSGPVVYSVPNFLDTMIADPYETDYSDETIELYEDDTGDTVPGSDGDPGRFMDRYNYLTRSDNIDDWTNWRCEHIKDLMLETRDLMHSYRSDLDIIQLYAFSMYPLKDRLLTGEPYLDWIKKYSMDPSLYDNEPNMFTTNSLAPDDRHWRATYTAGTERYTSYLGSWNSKVNQEMYDAHTTSNKRVIDFTEGWRELNYKYRADSNPQSWPIDLNWARFQMRMSGDYNRETFAYAMIGKDPQKIFHGFNDVGLTPVHGQEFREFSKVFTQLPDDQFQNVLGTSFDTNLAIRELQQGGTYWFYVVNPGYWGTTATLDLRNINSVIDLSTDQSRSTSGGTLTFDLGPYGMKAFRASTSSGRIASYSIAPIAEADAAHMRRLIAFVTEGIVKLENPLGITAVEESFIYNQAALAEQDLANEKYSAAWQKLTDWRYWGIAHDTIFVNLQLMSRFSANDAGGLTINFDGSEAASFWEPIVLYEWDFGDGTRAAGKTLSHTYASDGNYVVKLKVTTQDGETDFTAKNIMVGAGGGDIGAADVNQDGVVDIFDVVIVAFDVGKISGYDERADVASPSGSVDIYDLVYVAARFGQRGGGTGGTVVPSGQVAHWSFDGNLQDSQNSNHGTFYGGSPNYVTGKAGQALQFDGANDYVEVPHSSSLTFSNEVTVSAWVRINDDDTEHPIVHKADSSGSSFTFDIASGGNSLIFRTFNSGSYSDVINFASGIIDNGWRHVTAVYDGNTETVYIDGIEVKSEVSSLSSMSPATSRLTIGTSLGGSFLGSDFNGDIDEVRIFNRALDNYEILDVMYKGLPGE